MDGASAIVDLAGAHFNFCPYCRHQLLVDEAYPGELSCPICLVDFSCLPNEDDFGKYDVVQVFGAKHLLRQNVGISLEAKRSLPELLEQLYLAAACLVLPLATEDELGVFVENNKPELNGMILECLRDWEQLPADVRGLIPGASVLQ